MSEDQQADADFEMVKKAAEALGEHFDGVQIFATRYEPDGTVTVNYGQGNYYARYGHVKGWCTREDETFRDAARNRSE